MDDVSIECNIPPDNSNHVFPEIPPEFYNENMKPSAKECSRKGCSKRGEKSLNV
jgi:hypothetical protein